jgi:hypothetical protein
VWSIVSGSEYASITQAGILIANENASSSPVTIRCTSSANSSVYADKTVSVTAGDLVIKNYIQGDGVGFFILPGMYFIGGKITYRGTYSSGDNTYCLCSRYSEGTGTGAKGSRIAAYTNSSGKVTGAAGLAGFGTLTKSNVIYRYVWNCSSVWEATDGSCAIYNDETGAVLNSGQTGMIWLNGAIGIFTYMTGAPNTPNPSYIENGRLLGNGKFYGLTLEKNNEIIADYRACLYQGRLAIIDMISEEVYYPTNGSGLTLG